MPWVVLQIRERAKLFILVGSRLVGLLGEDKIVHGERIMDLNGVHCRCPNRPHELAREGGHGVQTLNPARPPFRASPTILAALPSVGREVYGTVKKICLPSGLRLFSPIKRRCPQGSRDRFCQYSRVSRYPQLAARTAPVAFKVVAAVNRGVDFNG